jgi:hypothetical protein
MIRSWFNAFDSANNLFASIFSTHYRISMGEVDRVRFCIEGDEKLSKLSSGYCMDLDIISIEHDGNWNANLMPTNITQRTWRPISCLV